MEKFLNERKFFVEKEKNLSELCKVGDVVRESDIVSARKWDGDFEKKSKSNHKSNVWS